MELRGLIATLPQKKGSVHTLERGASVSRSYATLYNDVGSARDRLSDWGVIAGTRVGIYAPNSYRWLVYDLALIELGAVSVPFTDDFGGAVDDSLLKRYNIGLLLLTKSNAHLFPDLPRYIAFIDAENAIVQVQGLEPPHDGDEGDQLSLVFSSGSAGGLKGLVISRKGVESTLPPIMDALGVAKQDRMLLFLPMSNFQQRFLCYAALWYDFDIILTEYTQLFSAIEKLNPSILLAPPVFYQMIYAEFAKYPPWKRALWLGAGWLIDLVPTGNLRRSLARLIFPTFYRQFGDSIRMLITGMAPIRRNIGRFFRLMQLPLCETYGMVEAGVMAFRPANCRRYDTVGKALRGVHFSIEGDGEIIVTRDHPLTLRYFQCANDENERTFVAPNRIATGDIGEIDQDGNLFLRGRKKELIVTSGGVKVHPETIEEELNNCPDVSNSVVFLEPDTSRLICVVALNQLGDEEARGRVRKLAQNLKTVSKVTQVVEVVFSEVPFSRENGMLRPNMKIDRKRIAARYGVGNVHSHVTAPRMAGGRS